MAGSATDYLENRLLDHALGTTAYTKPSALYLALYTAAPSDSAAGTEVTGGSYTRQAIAFTSAVSTGTASNTAAISFNNMPLATVVAVGLVDAASAGNLLFYSILPASKSYASGDTAYVAAGSISVVLN